MSDLPIRHIICAVRGGPESRATIQRAISEARKHQAALTFLHVVDAGFMDHSLAGSLRAVYQQLREMSQFAMIILCDRARMRGVEAVDYVLREGDVRKQLLAFAIETGAQLLVMGSPTRSPTRNVFQPGELEDFVGTLRREGAIQVIAVTPEPITGRQLQEGLQL